MSIGVAEGRVLGLLFFPLMEVEEKIQIEESTKLIVKTPEKEKGLEPGWKNRDSLECGWCPGRWELTGKARLLLAELSLQPPSLKKELLG